MGLAGMCFSPNKLPTRPVPTSLACRQQLGLRGCNWQTQQSPSPSMTAAGGKGTTGKLSPVPSPDAQGTACRISVWGGGCCVATFGFLSEPQLGRCEICGCHHGGNAGVADLGNMQAWSRGSLKLRLSGESRTLEETTPLGFMETLLHIRGWKSLPVSRPRTGVCTAPDKGLPAWPMAPHGCRREQQGAVRDTR